MSVLPSTVRLNAIWPVSAIGARLGVGRVVGVAVDEADGDGPGLR